MTTRNPAASVRARLLNKARADGVDFQLLLTRYGLERLLYRLSVSPERDNFLLKGALLFDLWYEVPALPGTSICWDLDWRKFLSLWPHLKESARLRSTTPWHLMRRQYVRTKSEKRPTPWESD